MKYVTIETVTKDLDESWADGGDANLAVMLANSWLNGQGIETFEGEVPEAVTMAGARIAQEVITKKMYQGRTAGIVASKSVKAGGIASSKTFAEGRDGQAITAGEEMALMLITHYISSLPLTLAMEVY